MSSCQKSNLYMPNESAQFTVKRPKYVVPTPMKQPIKEGFMLYPPTQSQVLVNAGLHGSTIGPTSNPWMGGLPGEVTYGVSVPGTNTTTLMGSGAGNPQVADMWRTVI